MHPKARLDRARIRRMQPWIRTLLAAGIVAALALWVGFIVGSHRAIDRFEYAPNGESGFAFDRKTGQTCWPHPSTPPGKTPACLELYKRY